MRFALTGALIFLLNGCVYLFENQDSNPSSQITGEPLPMTLSVVEEKFDGARLTVVATIKAKTSWNTENVIARLSTYKGSENIGESFYPVHSGMSGDHILDADAEHRFVISAEATDLTDYQLELLWGHEAKAFLVSVAKRQSMTREPIEIVNISVNTNTKYCGNVNCRPAFEVGGTLRVVEQGLLQTVTLGTTLTGTSSEDHRVFNEELVDIADLNLETNQEKSFRVLIEVPYEVSFSSVSPVVRVRSYTFKSM